MGIVKVIQRVNMLNIVQTDKELRDIHGRRDYYAYLRSPQFVEAFVRPMAEIIDGYGDPVLDVGCGDGMLSVWVDRCSYVGIDGARPAISRAFDRCQGMDRFLFYQARIEDPCILGEFPTCVMSGILEVLIKADQRVTFMEMYRERYRVKRFVVCDLERLDETAITAKYGKPKLIAYKTARPVEGVETVKLCRKIIVWEVES